MKNIIVAESTETGLSHFNARPEPMRKIHGLSCIRRSNPNGHHYFISNLQGKDVDAWVELGVNAASAVFYNPMDGNITLAQSRSKNEHTEVRMQLRSGESIILRTFAKSAPANHKSHKYHTAAPTATINLNKGWELSFKDCTPINIDAEFNLDAPRPWTSLGNKTLNTTMGTGAYCTQFNLKHDKDATYILDLGDVRESARVRVNGKDCGTLFAVPFRIDISDYLHDGENTLEVDVTNLPANRIAELDRQGVAWRRFKEINVVDLNYKKTTYAQWETVPSGLNSEVKIEVY